MNGKLAIRKESMFRSCPSFLFFNYAKHTLRHGTTIDKPKGTDRGKPPQYQKPEAGNRPAVVKLLNSGIMEKLQSKLTDWNVREVQRIKTLILDYCKTPDLILLYGQYVDGTPRKVTGGYEFLIVISEDDMKDREGVSDHIKEHFPVSERYETAFSVFIVSTEFFRANIRNVPYLNSIFRSGIVLHNCAPKLWEHISERKSVKQKNAQSIQEKANRCFAVACGFIDASDDISINRHWQVCPFLLYYAIEQVCMGAEYKYFGFVREFDHIGRRFDAIRYTSKRLAEYAENRRNELSKMFHSLNKQYQICLYSENSGYPLETVHKFTDIIREILDILADKCNTLAE